MALYFLCDVNLKSMYNWEFIKCQMTIKITTATVLSFYYETNWIYRLNIGHL